MTRSSATKALEALRCPICMDTASAPARLSSCGHLFCKPCIKAALHLKKECPVCRTATTHRKVQDATIDSSFSDLEVCSAPIPEGPGSWSCRSCTMTNLEAAVRTEGPGAALIAEATSTFHELTRKWRL